MKLLKGTLKGLVAGLIGLVLAVVLAEGLMRLVAPQFLLSEELRYAAHPHTGFRIQPDIYIPGRFPAEINELGLRGRSVGSKPDGEYRVLVLGDSFTYGAGVATEETFPEQLELLAGGQGEQPRRFVNGGTPAYGTLRELHWLESFGEEVDPDEILLAFFVGNDLTDNLDDSAPRIVDGRMVGAERADETDAALEREIFLRRFHLYRFWLAQQYEAPTPKPAGQRTEYTEEEKQRILEGYHDTFAKGQVARVKIYSSPERQPADVARAYEVGGRVLEELLAWCRQREIGLRVVLIPDVMQVENELLERVLSHVPWFDAEAADFYRPQAFVADWCRRNEVPVLDLLGPMRKHTAERSESLYLDFDSHWNARGHRLAAEELARAFYSGF